jgi:hypothetical protein
MKRFATFWLALACALPAYAQSRGVIGKAGVWVKGTGQGIVAYRAVAKGSSVDISCDVGQTEDHSATGISLEIAGAAFIPNAQVRFAVDGKAITIPSNQSGGVSSDGCPECARKFAQLWPMLREGRRLEITGPDGKSAAFPLEGLSQLMPAKPCAAGTGKAAQRTGLAGGWIFIAKNTRFPDACEGDSGITYKADGTYEMLEESGRWRLKGDRLTETPTKAHEAAPQPGSVKVGQSFTSRLQWQRPDTFTKTFPGYKVTLRRCP